MPTYEFRCPNGHEFEQFYSRISLAPSIVKCPTCGVVAEKLMSAGAGLVFKGSGFYITDYGKDGKKDQPPPAAASSGDSAASTDAPKPASSDAKPSGESGAPRESRASGEGKPSSDSKPSSDTKPSSANKPSSDAKPSKAARSGAPKGAPKSPGRDA